MVFKERWDKSATKKQKKETITNGKAEEFTHSVCIVERKTRPPSQDYSTPKQSLDEKAEEEACTWSHGYQKIRLYGNRRLGLSCSFLQAYNQDASARLHETESFNPCLQCLSQCRFPNSRSPQAVTTRVMSWDWEVSPLGQESGGGSQACATSDLCTCRQCALGFRRHLHHILLQPYRLRCWGPQK